MRNVITVDEAVSHLKDGMTFMIGGFLDVGTPLKIVEKLRESNLKDLTLIFNVGSFPGGKFGSAPLFEKVGMIKKLITSHVGVAPEHLNAYKRGEIEVEFYPMGTLVEKIRAAGSGLGGVVTPTGVGTLMQDGRQTITINGKEFIVEPPLKADVAFVKGYAADKYGSVACRRLQKANNPIMALAADYVVCEVNELVDELDPDAIDIVAPVLDGIVKGYSFEEENNIYRNIWNERKKFRAS